MVAINYPDSWYDVKFLPTDPNTSAAAPMDNETEDFFQNLERMKYEYLFSDIKCKGNMTTETVFNFSLREVCDLIKKSQQTRVLVPETEVILIVMYVILMASGIVSNLLVCFVVMRQCAKKKMDFGSSGPKSRHLFIVNLAVADLELCFFCMPFTLIMLIQQRWTLGTLLCKLVPVVQGTSIMVSAGTITAIAFDRYITIVRSPRSRHLHNNACCTVAVTIIAIWILSFAVTSPLFFYTGVEAVSVGNFMLYEQCIEQWPSNVMQCVFTIALALVQFVIPVIVLTVIHLKISAYLKLHLKPINKSKPKIQIHSPNDPKQDEIHLELQNNEEDVKDEDASKKELLNIHRKESVCSENSQKSYESARKSSDCSRKFSESSRKNSDCSDAKRNSCDISPRKRSDFLTSFRENSEFSGFSFSRFSEKSRSNKNHKRARRELRRNRRTMFMLSCIAVVYAVSWLPMTLFQVIVYLDPAFISMPSTHYLIFAGCHILAMTTAITNPLLYGWLNTNFRREFSIIFSSISIFFSKIFKRELNASLSNKTMVMNNNNTDKNVDEKAFVPVPQNSAQFIGQPSCDRRISFTYVTGKMNSTAVTVVSSTPPNLQL